MPTILPIHVPDLVRNSHGQLLYEGNLEHYYRCKWSWCEVRGHNFPCHGITSTNYLLWESYDAMLWAYKKKFMGPLEPRALMIAACLTNINRSSKKGFTAMEQLDRSVEAMQEILLPEDRGLSELIEKIMRAGLFIIPRPKLTDPTVSEKILHDLSMTQIFCEYHMEHLYFNLAKELGLTSKQMLGKLPEFLSEIEHFETEHALHKYSPKIKARLSLREDLFLILKGA